MNNARSAAQQPQCLVIDQRSSDPFVAEGPLRGVTELTAQAFGDSTLVMATAPQATLGLVVAADGGVTAQRVLPSSVSAARGRALSVRGATSLFLVAHDAALARVGASVSVVDGGPPVQKPSVLELGADGGLLLAYSACPGPQRCELRALPLDPAGVPAPGVMPSTVAGGAGAPLVRAAMAWNDAADAGLLTWEEDAPGPNQVRGAWLDRQGVIGAPFLVAPGQRHVVVPRGNGFEVLVCTHDAAPELYVHHVPAGASAPDPSPYPLGPVDPFVTPAAATRGDDLLVAFQHPRARALILLEGAGTTRTLQWVGEQGVSSAPLAVAATPSGWFIASVEGPHQELRHAALDPAGDLARPPAALSSPLGVRLGAVAYDGTQHWLLAVPEGRPTWLDTFTLARDGGWSRAGTVPLAGGTVEEVALAADQGEVLAVWTESSGPTRRLLARAVAGRGLAAGQLELTSGVDALRDLRASARDGGFLVAWQRGGDVWLRAVTPGIPLTTPTTLTRPGSQRPTSLVPWGSGWALGVEAAADDGGVRPLVLTFSGPAEAAAATPLVLREAPTQTVYAMAMGTVRDALFASWSEFTETGLVMNGVRVGADRQVASWDVASLSTARVAGEALVAFDGTDVVVPFVELGAPFRLPVARFTADGVRRADPVPLTLPGVGNTEHGSIATDGRGRTVAAVPVRLGLDVVPPVGRLEFVHVLNLAGGEPCDAARPEVCASGVCLDGFCAGFEVPLGGACQLDSSCLSGFCADGVCCESACGAGSNPCLACSRAKGSSADGQCEPRSATTVCASPSECTEARCDGAGTCQAPAPREVGTTCAEGTCNAAGVCEAPAPMPQKPAGCGCSSGGLELWAAATALVAWARRRRVARG